MKQKLLKVLSVVVKVAFAATATVLTTSSSKGGTSVSIGDEGISVKIGDQKQR